MRIIFINTSYDMGSTGKLSKSFLAFASHSGNDVAMVFSDGPDKIEIPFLKVKRKITRKVTILFERLFGTYNLSPISTLKTIRFIKTFKPDIVYLGNLHGYYINFKHLYKAIGNMDVPIVQVLWDEFPMTGSCAFSFDCVKFMKNCCRCPRKKDYPQSWIIDNSYALQLSKKSIYERIDRICFVSVPYTAERARNSMLLKNKKIIPLDEAVEQEKYFYPRNSSGLKRDLNIPKDNVVILTVGVYPNERKGCQYFLELARKCLDYKEYTFLHVGFNGNKNECPSNYLAIGYVSDQDLMAKYYSLGDLFVCTSMAETQPNTCLEALSCGTPICGFDVSGTPTCAEYPYGEYVESKDVLALKEIVLKTKKKTKEKIRSVSSYAKERFSSQKYNNELLKIGTEILDLE